MNKQIELLFNKLRKKIKPNGVVILPEEKKVDGAPAPEHKAHEHHEHHEHHESQHKESNPWMYVSILLAVLLVVSLYFNFSVLAKVGSGNNQPSVPSVPSNNPSNNQPNNNEPEFVQVSADDDEVLGNANAKVTIVEFSDFECPFCGRFYTDTLVPMKKDYVETGKVKFIYRDFPLSSIHPDAEKAAEAAECAGEQGKYYAMHDTLFANQQALDVTSLKGYASALGLDTAKFNSCLDSGKMSSEVANDFQDGVTAGVQGTPTLFINGKKLVGAQPYNVVRAAIEAELAK